MKLHTKVYWYIAIMNYLPEINVTTKKIYKTILTVHHITIHNHIDNMMIIGLYLFYFTFFV